MATLANIQRVYTVVLQDRGALLGESPAVSLTEVRDSSILEAIRWYARKLPLVKTSLIGNGATAFYAVPADWVEGSRIVSIEFPLDQTPPQYVTRRGKGGGVTLQRRETGVFYFLSSNPTGPFRLTYTASRNTDASDIRVDHEEIVGRMAAAIAAANFAAFYANTVQNNVDSVNYRSKEQEWRAVRKELLAEVEMELRRD